MPPEDNILEGYFHIPFCGQDVCSEDLSKLSAALKNGNVHCITEYRPNGKFVVCFEEAYKNCTFTVIHKCPKLWKRIKASQDLLSSDNCTKLIGVQFVKSNKEKKLIRSKSTEDSDIEDFFDDLNTKNIKTEADLNDFVRQLMTLCVHISVEEKDSSPESTDTHQEESMVCSTSASTPSSVDNLISVESSQIDTEESVSTSPYGGVDLTKYPGIFGDSKGSYLRVKKQVMQCPDQLEMNCSNLKDCANVVEHLNKLKLHKLNSKEWTAALKFVFHKILPALHNSKLENLKVLGLAYLGLSKSDIIQRRTVQLLTLLLFNAPSLDWNIWVNLETILYAGLVDLRSSKDVLLQQQHKYETVVAVGRLIPLYVMVLSRMIMSCKDNKQKNLCNIHLMTLSGRSFAEKNSDSDVEKQFKDLDVFIEEICRKKCAKFITHFENLKWDQEKVQNLGKATFSTQAVMICEILNQLFKERKKKMLDLLVEYVENRSRIFEKLCPNLLVQGVVLFLSYGLKSTDADCKEMCENSVESVIKELKDDVTEEVKNLIQMLHFNKNPSIRKGIKETTSEQDLIVNELERLFCPLLTVKKPEKETKLEKETDKVAEERADKQPARAWLKCKFDESDGLIAVQPEDGKVKKETLMLNFHLNELKALCQLQHENIVPLLAYQTDQVPQFYIIGDFSTNNLQEQMKSKREGHDYFSQTSLLKFLVDVASALEYCHKQEFAHRNVFAASVFLMQDNMAVLSGFHLCVKLDNGQAKSDDETDAYAPTQWTALESLCRGGFSKKSDVWMLGHLMYEVLTHGLLPYSDKPFQDPKELATKIVDGSFHLCGESCIKKEHRKLISDCTAPLPGDRPEVRKVQKDLTKFLKEVADIQGLEKSPDYPSATDPYKMSTEYNLGIPELGTEAVEKVQQYKSKITLPQENLDRLEIEGKYIFKEKQARKVSQIVSNKLESGVLKDILPEIRVYQNRDEECFIECTIPSSCKSDLLELALKNLLGDSVEPYLQCVYEMALILKELCERSWVLGDMCASNLYVEKRESGFKVHVISLAYLHDLNVERPSYLPRDPIILDRMALEVVKDGIERCSFASDVYCFANLVWEVLQAFDYEKEKFHEFERDRVKILNDIKLNKTIYEQKSMKKWEENHPQPICCNDNLYGLLRICTNSDEHRRPQVHTVVEQLYRIITEDYNVQLSHAGESTSL